MQTKRYESLENGTLGTGQLNEIIENQDNLKVNFHGIRFKGRIKADHVSADNASSGYVGVMCINQAGTTIPTLQTETDLRENYTYIIAVEPWYTYGGSTTQNEVALHDFDFALKTTRTCPRDGRLIGFISNRTGGKNQNVNSLISAFETQA